MSEKKDIKKELERILGDEDITHTKSKLFRISVMLIVGMFLVLAAAPVSTKSMQPLSSNTTKKIWVNGRSVDAFLTYAGGTGFINVSQNQINNTVALDFSYSTDYPPDPNIALIFQGADQIPSSAVTFTDTSVHLSVTTPPSYFVNLCYFNLTTFEATCGPGAPLTFDLTWEVDGFVSIHEKTQRVETLGPVVTKINAEYNQQTALVHGMWDGHTGTDLSGNILDTQSKSFLREITVNATP